MSDEETWRRIDNVVRRMAHGQKVKQEQEMIELRRLHQALVVAQRKTDEQLRATDEKLDRIIRRDEGK